MRSSFASCSSQGHLNCLVLAVAATLGGMVLEPAGAHAQGIIRAEAAPDRVTVDIPPGRLSGVLETYANQAGVLLSADSRFLAGLNSPGLRGTFEVEHGFAALLRSHDLEVQRNAQGIYVLRALPANPGRVAELDAVEVTGQLSEADRPFQTAGSAQYISRDQIERFRGSSVGDIFQGTPGVLVAENRNSGGLDVNIRGMQGQGRVPVLLDGSRQETTVYRGYMGVSSRTYIDPDLIGGIDINKGPVMTAEGAGAVGGVVSMRTLSADDILMPGKSFSFRVRGVLQGNSVSPPPAGTAGGLYKEISGAYLKDCIVSSHCNGKEPPTSFGGDDLGMNRPKTTDLRSWAGSLAVAQRFEKIDLVAAYARRSQGNYYTGKHGPVPELSYRYVTKPFWTEVYVQRNYAQRYRAHEEVLNSANDSESVLLKTNLQLPADQTLELSYMRYDSHYGEMMPSQILYMGPIRQTADSEVTANTLTSRYRWNPMDKDWLDLRANVWTTRTKTINRNYSEDFSDASGVVTIQTPERYRRVGGDISNTVNFEVLGSHVLTVGASMQHEDVDTVRPLNESGVPVGNTAYGRDGDRKEYSLFTNWKWEPVEGLELNAGVRYIEAEVNDHKPIGMAKRAAFCLNAQAHDLCSPDDTIYVDNPYCLDRDADGVCDPVYYQTRDSGTAPVVSLAWAPWNNGLQFYGRYAKGLRMPSLFEGSQGWSVSPAFNLPLRAERAVNKELGLNFLGRDLLSSGDRVAFKFARFYNRTQDYITRTNPNEGEGVGQRFFVIRNVDSVDVRGFEAMLEYDAGPVYTRLNGAYYDDIEVCYAGSYRRHTCTDYGVKDSYFNNMIPPKWHASAILGARLFEQRLDIGVRGTFMGMRNQTPDFDDDTAGGFLFVIPWQRYKVFDVYATWKQSKNLSVSLNIDNVTDRYYLDALGLGLVPAPGRTARLSFTLQY